MPMNPMLPALSDVTLHHLVWLALGLAALPMLWLLTFYNLRVRSIGRTARRRQWILPEKAEGITVIVHSSGHHEALEQLLQSLFDQEYSGPMEVVVVNVGKSAEVKDVVTRFKYLNHRHNLYITFTPPGVRNLSPRKLSITLGAKAAHYPLLVLTDENARPSSRLWLQRLTAPFASPQVQVVVAPALPDHSTDTGRGCRRYRAFTHAADLVQWLSAAVRRRVYRGDHFNLAYRRDAFFDNRGFSSSLNLLDGDDDIFINRISTPSNAVAVVSPDAMITYATPTSSTVYGEMRPRRYFTARRLRHGSSRFFGFSSCMMWMLTLLTLAAAVTAGLTHAWVECAVAAVMLLGTWTVLCLTWRSVMRTLDSRRLCISVPLMLLRRPFTNLHHRLLAMQRRKEYFSWS